MVTYSDEILFDPSWGTYDMAVGSKISSVFSGAADKDAYQQPTIISKMRVIKQDYTDTDKALHALYQQLRDYRAGKNPNIDLKAIWQTHQKNHAYDWLLAVELLEIIVRKQIFLELEQKIRTVLLAMVDADKELHNLIHDGISLIDNPLKSLVNS